MFLAGFAAGFLFGNAFLIFVAAILVNAGDD